MLSCNLQLFQSLGTRLAVCLYTDIKLRSVRDISGLECTVPRKGKKSIQLLKESKYEMKN
jgi:hypothetical protein